MKIGACAKLLLFLLLLLLLLLLTFQIGYMEFSVALDDILIKFLILPVRRQKEFIFIFKAWSLVRFPDCSRVCSGRLGSGRCLHNGLFP